MISSLIVSFHEVEMEQLITTNEKDIISREWGIVLMAQPQAIK